MVVRVRFAPSPTGMLHVGNMRIAILNYLFAKKSGGIFILRIDDTDVERSTDAYEKDIIEGLEWLGIQWDEFYRQSANFSKYEAAAEHLKNTDRIYPCYETKEELSLGRKISAAKGIPPVYDRAALNLSEEKRCEMKQQGRVPYWRFRLSDSQTMKWDDLIHGKMSIPLDSISDPILIKSDGTFVYTLASVVDDINMEITHIIRGDDHITNTAVQMDIFQAISGKCPTFAHVPLLSAIDGEDISKRSGSSLSIANMRNEGIDPWAIMCEVATLGTSNNANPRDDLDALIEKFSLKKMSLSSPKFNPEETKMLTKKIIAEKSFSDVKTDLERLNLKNVSQEFWDAIRGNLTTIRDVIFWNGILFDEINVVKENENFVNQMLNTLEAPLNFEEWKENLSQVSGKCGKDLFHPIRVILTGLNNGPELAKIVHLIGYDRIKSRIENNLKAK